MECPRSTFGNAVWSLYTQEIDSVMRKEAAVALIGQSGSAAQARVCWLLVGAILVGACAGSDVNTPADAPSAAVSPGDLAGNLIFYKGPFSPEEEAQIGALISGFNATYPNVEVVFEQFDWEAMGQQFPTRFLADDPPDVNAVPDLEYGKWVERGAFEDLTPYVTSPEWAEEFAAIPEEVWDIARGPDGNIYGIPWWGVVLSMLFVNLDLLEQAGVEDFNSSFDAFADAAKRVDELNENTFGFAIRTDQFNPAAFDWAAWLHTANTRLLTDDWTSCAANSSEAQETFAGLANLIAVEKLAPEPGAYEQQGLQDLFIEGRVGITHDASGFVSTLLAEDLNFEFDVGAIPPGAGGNQSTGMWGVGLLTMASKSQDKEAAWELIKYLTSAEVVVDYFTKTALLPNRTDVADRMFEGDPYSATVVDEILPGVRGWQLHPDLNEMLGRAQPSFDRLYRGQATAEEALAEVCGVVDEIVG